MQTSDFARYAGARVLVGDGAMGTMLHAAGHAYDGSLAALNLSRPAVVSAIHDSYVAAGADVIQTNTFGASRLRLALHGQAELVRDINLAGAKIAHEAAAGSDRRVFVAGSVSPAVTAGQRSRVSDDERAMALREQLEALSEGRVDLLLLETYSYLDELVEAIELAAGLGLPIIAQATFTESVSTLSGHSPREVAVRLRDLPVSVIGVNCTIGPRRMSAVVTELAAATSIPLSVQPNAGQPERLMPAQHVRFSVDAEYFARFVPAFVEAGAVLVGGCCGTTPTIIRAVANEAAGHAPRREVRVIAPQTRASRAVAHAERPKDVAGRLAGGDFVVAAELSPRSASTIMGAVDAVRALRDHGVDVVLVPSELDHRAETSPLSLTIALRQRTSVEPLLAVSTWDKSLMTLQAEMLGAHAMEIHGIVAETGGRPPVGDYPLHDDLWRTDSLGLIHLLAGLNDGRDSNELPVATRTKFTIGARCNLGREDLEAEIARTISKVRAGARFVITRPVYEAHALRRLREALDPEGVPIVATIRALTSVEEAEYLFYEVPDVRIPKVTLEALEAAESPGHGVELARALLLEIAPLVNGVVVAADLESDLAVLIDAARQLVAVEPGPH